MTAWNTRLCFCILSAALLVSGPVFSQEERDAGGDVSRQLSVIREDLIQLRLEEALASLDTLLERTDLTRTDRTEAWILRSRAHVAFGDLDAAMEDYREILSLRPGFRPESSLITPDAEARFNRLRAEMISTLKLDIQPEDAVLIIDGETIRPSATGTVAVLAGSRRIRLEKRGYDPLDEELDLPAGVEFGYQRQLFPNARDVVIRSWVPGVQVLVDGIEAGFTARSAEPSGGTAGSQDGKLVIQDMSLGEHQFEFRMDCHLSQRLKRMVTVDIMEPTPLLLPRLELEPIRIPLVVRADFPAAGIFIDGEQAGDLQSDLIYLCPGERSIELRSGGRTVHLAKVDARDGGRVEIEASARPTAILTGAGTWPDALQAAGERFSLLSGVTTPLDRGVGDPDRWEPGDFPPDVDLVFAVLGEDEFGGGRTVVYSPPLNTWHPLTPERVDALAAPRPSWHVWAAGVRLIESPDGTGLLAATVRPGGAAAKAGVTPGARLVSVGGVSLRTPAEVRAALEGGGDGGAATLRFLPAGGGGSEPILVEPAPKPSPYLAGPALRGLSPEWTAAWARVDAAAYPDRTASALANLALALAEAGDYPGAVEVWKKVRWGDRAGVGEGTRAYYLGIAMDRIGREDEAIRAFRRAAGSGATVFSDDGPPVAPPARDHLTDLGISMESPGN